MKFFKYSIMAMMALAVSLTSCSDDDKYADGAQSPGAYFANDLPATVDLGFDGGSFDVTVNRTGTDAAATYNLVANDPSGLFTFPATVSFAENELTTLVNVTFDPAQIVTDKKYPITLTIEGASEYGNATYSFNAVRANPITTEELGVGTFTYASYLNGYSEAEVVKSFNPATPGNQTFTMAEWGMSGIPFSVVVPDADNLASDGTTPCYVRPQYSGMDSEKYGQVWVADMYTYLIEQLNRPDLAAEYVEDTYFTPERGLFTLHLIYYIPFYEDGGSYLSEGEEYLQLAGYPDYSIAAEYLGTMILPNGNFAANAQITPGEDVASFKAVLVPGSDPTAGIEAILGEAEGVQEFKGNSEVTAEFPIEEGGVYTIVAVSFDANGDPAELAYDTFEVTIGAPAYEEVGSCDYEDGFIAPGFGDNFIGITFAVPLLQSTKDPNVMYLNSPYTQPDFPLIKNNSNTMPYRIAFDITDPSLVLIGRQVSGFYDERNFGGMVEIGNREGVLAENNPGASTAAIKAFMLENGYTEFSTLEDGIVTINNCRFSDKGEFGYQWNSETPGHIYLPEASAVAKKRNAAKNVVRPKFNGMMKLTAQAQMQKKAKLERNLEFVKPANKIGNPIRLK